MLVGALALSIGAAIYDLTVRELDLSQTATQSQYAIYAADTGVECALYWDAKCTLGAACYGGSAFATSSDSTVPSSGSGINCNGQDISSVWTTTPTPTSATTTFKITFTPQPYCVFVTVFKSGTPLLTTTVAHGYNTSCPPASPGTTRLERTLQVTY
jgi:hypothetical protein